VEATARDLGVRIVMEGYPPPRDPRLKMLAVTPDPGVIEVNIHPAHNWKELVAHTEFLYNAAFETRLSAEKFMTDGRHTGTGGGNHFVMGGATPADSPFLRRPELLASLLLYWHNHPSLSYLFSGMFIGPTSQAPRVDEARNDQVYELEIALKEIAKNRELYGQNMPAWLVDRTLRNILIDVSGNTHRSEFCIDKLYSPDSSTGRLGLLELRAFEMPPHARMSIAQQLLIRALVARFWDEPYKAPVTRWGTELHDRFLLPTFVKMDFDDVISEMRQAGFAFDADWFAPHFEFRFPLVGQMQAMGVELSLRNALEPWHVMGEEGSAGGTVRYVDSSLERIEVRVTGLNESRHVITVNGKVLPLQPTGVTGEFVAGRALQGMEPAFGAAPEHRRARTADLRPGRHLDEAFAGRLPVLRGPPGRAQLRHLPGERLRGREPPPFALHAHRPHAGADAHAPRHHRSPGQPRIPVHAGSAPIRGPFAHRPQRTAVTGV
jgi:uncharacterized protein (DUF2126 family)